MKMAIVLGQMITNNQLENNYMKKHLIISGLMFMVGIASIVFGIVTNDPPPPALFDEGEILYPGYVHADTLIVIDAKGLNKAFHEQDPATDSEIMNVLLPFTKKY